MSDTLTVVETAYRVGGDGSTWLRAVAEAARPLLDAGLGVLAYEYDTRRPQVDWVANPVVLGADARFCEAVLATNERMAPVDRALAYKASGPAATSSQLFAGGRSAADYEAVSPFARSLGFSDFVGVNAANPAGFGVILGAPLPRVTSLAPAAVQRWERVAAHVAAALRLRHALAQEEAVLRPDGRVEHAANGARGRLRALQGAVRAVDRARTRRMRTRAPAAALAMWQGLVSGTWSLLERFEADGKRYYVAHPNEPTCLDPRGLSPRERSVAGYLAMGHTNKLIAYELGISEGAVSAHVAHVKRKLGATSRIEIIERLELTACAGHAEVSAGGERIGVVAVEPPSPAARPDLTPRERQVAERVLAGRSAASIAAALGCARHTVERHLEAVYRKLGVRSRTELHRALRGAGAPRPTGSRGAR